MTIIKYSDEELLTIREIYASTETISSQIHRLPARTKESIVAKAKTLGLVKNCKGSLGDRLAALMADGRPRTARACEKSLREPRKYILDVFSKGIVAEKYHVVDYHGTSNAMVFKAGAGVNAPKPPKKEIDNRPYARAHRARYRDDPAPKQAVQKKRSYPENRKPRPVIDDRTMDDRHRRPGSWWPDGDPVVSGAIRAMVQVGRASA